MVKLNKARIQVLNATLISNEYLIPGIKVCAYIHETCIVIKEKSRDDKLFVTDEINKKGYLTIDYRLIKAIGITSYYYVEYYNGCIIISTDTDLLENSYFLDECIHGEPNIFSGYTVTIHKKKYTLKDIRPELKLKENIGDYMDYIITHTGFIILGFDTKTPYETPTKARFLYLDDELFKFKKEMFECSFKVYYAKRALIFKYC